MTDREKVVKGLEQFIADFKPFCGNKSDWQRVDDALALLKAQEPMVMTDTELEAIRKAPIVLKPNVDAIPVEWLKAQIRSYTGDVSDIGKSARNGTIKDLIRKWQNEQEAR